MNVLLTSAGRRSYLVEYFKEAVKGSGGRVIVANSQSDAAAMYVAEDTLITPPASSYEYIPFLLDFCENHNVGMICSLHDLDVFVLSMHKNSFIERGIFPVVPDEPWGRICLDKYECHEVLIENGFKVPWGSLSLDETLMEVKLGTIAFPVIVKDRYGYGSGGLHRCESEKELRLVTALLKGRSYSGEWKNFLPTADLDQSIFYQQAILGEEYCVDIVNDLQGNYQAQLGCRVHAMRAGETDRVTIVDPCLFGDIPKKLSKITRHPGIWGVDMMWDGESFKIIDMNPRFTGDYPFHQISGADIPSALLAWAERRSVDPQWLSSTPGIKGYKALVPSVF